MLSEKIWYGHGCTPSLKTSDQIRVMQMQKHASEYTQNESCFGMAE